MPVWRALRRRRAGASAPPRRRRSGALRGLLRESRQGGAEAGLGVDEEVGRGDHLLAGAQAIEDLVVATRLAAELHGAGREGAGAADDEDDLLMAAGQDGVGG